MRISILIPCHNEEKSIAQCIDSCLSQVRQPDEIVVVNDGSTDNSLRILESFGETIKVVNINPASGNKSYAQEYGLRFVTGEIVVMTDGDTILDKDFIKEIEQDLKDEKITAVAGYVKSIKNNWLTACRELDYILGQELYKRAQALINFLYVIPGCAGAFRKDVFKKAISFEHDTITEDLDFTFKLHRSELKIKYNRRAICYTQDPFTLKAYINQMRRWYGGGWQNYLKHFYLLKKANATLVLSTLYLEGLLLSLFIIFLPFFNLAAWALFVVGCFIFSFLLGFYGAVKRKRPDLFFYSAFYLVLLYINAFIFLEQFVREVIFRQRSLFWFQPERKRL